MSEYQPCPFCGSPDPEGHSGSAWLNGPYLTWIQCKACSATGPHKARHSDAARAWNRVSRAMHTR